MRFQEEVISKIMTYFTVILLLGILIFEVAAAGTGFAQGGRGVGHGRV